MAISEQNIRKAKSLITIGRLSIKLYEKSEILNESEKAGYLAIVSYAIEFLENGLKNKKLRKSELTQLEDQILEYWNSSTNNEIESFWRRMAKDKYPIKRKDTIEKIILNQRFKNVEQAIDIFNSIKIQSQKRRRKLQIDLEKVIKIDQEKRISQLRKCIRNNRVSNSDYLKFGENYAYIIRTNQFVIVLDKSEQNILQELRLKK